MLAPKLTSLEFRIMEILWAKGECSIREIIDALPGKRRPAYTTIQTTVQLRHFGHVCRRLDRTKSRVNRSIARWLPDHEPLFQPYGGF
jgi:BlaI family transcriptional regulator, penicillinase repressor